MEHAVKIFTNERFGKLRVVFIDGSAWFVGKDVADALRYKNSRKAIKDHVDKEDQKADVTIRYTSSNGVTQNRKMTVINKSGVYSLILDSQLPKAKEYRHWVTSEVLPQIDETGSYSVAAPAAKKPDLARVYLLRLSDGSVLIVKIGHSKNIRARVAKIKRETGLHVVGMYFTPEMPRKDARLVEWATQEQLSSRRVKGEFFSVDFDEARNVVDYLVEITLAALPNQPANLIADS